MAEQKTEAQKQMHEVFQDLIELTRDFEIGSEGYEKVRKIYIKLNEAHFRRQTEAFKRGMDSAKAIYKNTINV